MKHDTSFMRPVYQHALVLDNPASLGKDSRQIETVKTYPLGLEGLDWLTDPSPSRCGCVWKRCREYGDVVLSQCQDHAIGSALGSIEFLAKQAVRSGFQEDAPELERIMRRFGPGAQQLLRTYYEREKDRLRGWPVKPL